MLIHEKNFCAIIFHAWKRGRAVEGVRLESVRAEMLPEFESLRFR